MRNLEPDLSATSRPRSSGIAITHVLAPLWHARRSTVGRKRSPIDMLASARGGLGAGSAGPANGRGLCRSRSPPLADGDPLPLIAHAYVRYLGDLNGGQILGAAAREDRSTYPTPALSFYEFPEIADLRAFRTDYRAAFDIAGESIADRTGLLDEVVAAFEMNIEVSERVGSTAVAA